MKRIAQAYFRALKIVTVLCLAALVVLVFGKVLLRYGFNSGITVSEELARLFFVYLSFCGAIVAMRERLHLGTDMVVRRLPHAARKACFVAGHLLMLGATLLFLQESWHQALINLQVKSPVTGFPVAVLYGAGVLS
ncbi:TRAP transporter small permease [Caldimonas tepidiphila]|uniref:TRAP transporter small permease n=1 Tax=Caldimonas tepidiphila TaxID=2315841 RepID=UPI000E5BEDCE|nr:TRAP transporter small permease [Caldimonas tepidiphila]